MPMLSRSEMGKFFQTHPLILAPMAGVSDRVYRQLCLEQGASLAFTEMVSAKGLSYANEKTHHLLDLAGCETQVGVQLFGHEPLVMAQQAKILEEELGDRLAIIDINMGCPARKIVSKGDGSSLMQRPQEAEAIVQAVVNAVQHPVTVKFRRGYVQGEETAVDFAKRMEQAGVWAITVHGRYAMQMYRGISDDGCIARVKDAVSVPVVGNGDITGPDRCLELKQNTGCDAVMIARGSQGNPWIFRDCLAVLENRKVPPCPSYSQRLAMARRHAWMLAQIHGDRIVLMRKQAMWYLTGMPGAAAARRELSACVTYDDFDRVFTQLEDRLCSEGGSYDSHLD